MMKKQTICLFFHEIITRTEMWRSSWPWGTKPQLHSVAVLELTEGMRGISPALQGAVPGSKRHPIPAREGVITGANAKESDKMKVV